MFILLRDRYIQNLLWASTFAACIVLGPAAKAQRVNPPTEMSPATTTQTYLYGEQPQPDQAGATYMVVQLRGNRAVGALYQPNSEFECFVGELQAERLAMTFMDFDSTGMDTATTWDYTIAIAPSTLVAGQNPLPTLQPQLIGFYPLNHLTAQAQERLATCQRVQQDGATQAQ